MIGPKADARRRTPPRAFQKGHKPVRAWLPSEAEIREACRRIQAGWDAATEASRRGRKWHDGGEVSGLGVPIVRLADCRLECD